MTTVDFTFFEVGNKWHIQNNSTMEWFEVSFETRREAMYWLFNWLMEAEKSWH